MARESAFSVAGSDSDEIPRERAILQKLCTEVPGKRARWGQIMRIVIDIGPQLVEVLSPYACFQQDLAMLRPGDY